MERERSAKVYLKDDARIPADIEKNGHVAHVYIQRQWETGEFKNYIQKNGCGHCCVAMALALNGVSDVTPHDEYVHCRQMWGAPKEEEPFHQGHFLSTVGVYKSVTSYGVAAEYVPIPTGGESACADRLYQALEEGKTAIFWSHPFTSDNPFSTGDHYVLAAGLTDDGNILIANSSIHAKTDHLGVQIVTKQTIADALWGNDSHPDATWGNGDENLAAGFVIVG